METKLTHGGTRLMPPLIYGTAWKEGETERLVRLALARGFRAFDTANQRKHYFEEGVGRALGAAMESGMVERDELFLQSKFTFVAGQDARLPYDPLASVADQVRQSFRSSLEHLRTTWLDSLILHGPSLRIGIGDADREAWRGMEELHELGFVRALGVSNVSLPQLETLFDLARVKPRFVQNRCFASRGWDAAVRDFCRENGLVYQAFSLLTANGDVLADGRVRAMARRRAVTEAQVIFRFALEVGMIPLTGTTQERHMDEDLHVAEGFGLDAGERELLERISLSSVSSVRGPL